MIVAIDLFVVLLTSCQWRLAHAHGRLIEPPSRASAWRYGFETPPNYNDHELFCGGYTRQWQRNEGRCGVCGDPWDVKTPRAHEYGGTYGQAVIVRKYGSGAVMTVRVELTANHMGYFQFALCADYKHPTQTCLDANPLKLYQRNQSADNYLFYPKDGNKVYEIPLMLPRGRTCQHCLLQWRYTAGNNWGMCPNGTGAVGCGPQEEFRACADITIDSKSVTDQPFSVPPSIITDETTQPIFSSLIVTLLSFFMVCLVLCLISLHFYPMCCGQPYLTGTKQLIEWFIALGTLRMREKTLVPPVPPPRTRHKGVNCIIESPA